MLASECAASAFAVVLKRYCATVDERAPAVVVGEVSGATRPDCMRKCSRADSRDCVGPREQPIDISSNCSGVGRNLKVSLAHVNASTVVRSNFSAPLSSMLFSTRVSAEGASEKTGRCAKD